MWDEENRLRSVQDNGAFYHYIYDASGERVIKGKSIGQRVFVNGELKAGSGGMGNYQVYVNPYIVLRSGGYTKHHYIEGQRIVSKLGSGFDNNGKGPLKAGGDKINYSGKSRQLVDAIVKNLKFLGADGQILTAGKSGKVPPGQIKGGSTSTAEKFLYFYHPDHLGSTSYVTDASGEVYQHLEYFAFGETFVEEHSNTDRTPYLFNGKEQDEETGLYYYGARYYDARTSVWLSVDPFAEKYSAITPYCYLANNPLNAIDPDGRKIYFVNASGELKKATRAMIRTISGSQLYNKYVKSDKVDVYISSADFGSNASAAGMTVPDANKSDKYGISISKDSKLKMDSRLSKEVKSAFTPFENVDFSKSEGKSIHLISMSNESLKQNDAYTNAEAIFHELKAHVDLQSGDMNKEHDLYGKTAVGLYMERTITDPYGQVIPDAKGNDLKEIVPKDSAAGKMVKELINLKKSDSLN